MYHINFSFVNLVRASIQLASVWSKKPKLAVLRKKGFPELPPHQLQL